MNQIELKPGREKSLLRFHPWIFSGAIDHTSEELKSGETAKVTDAKGNFLAWAGCSPDSQITARVWSFCEAEEPGRELLHKRISAAVELRKTLGLMEKSTGCRLIFSEADDLPGVTVDRYGEYAVLQISAACAEPFRKDLGELLVELAGVRGVYERSDAGIRRKEGLPLRSGQLCGAEVPAEVEIEEDGLRYLVDLHHGQKTGFYFDLRTVRQLLRRYAATRKMLNVFAYTGAFAASALQAGASHVVNVDSSAPALARAEENLKRNGFTAEQFENRVADGFEELRRIAASGKTFDLIVLDPPKLIDSRNALMRGCRAYQDLARFGFKLLNPGGVLLNLSCSGLMTPELFQKITAAAALEANCNAQILHRVEQSPDHPTNLAVPETFYLNGLLSRKLN